MQIRRVLLLFALVLGLSALVAALAPPPEEADDEPPSQTAAVPATPPATPTSPLRITLRKGTRRVPLGSSFALEVPVREPGDVVIDDLGVRQSADPRSPARFYLLAGREGRHVVAFASVDGNRRVIGRIEFAEPATVTPPQRGR